MDPPAIFGTVASAFSVSMDFHRLYEISKSIYGKKDELHDSIDDLRSTIACSKPLVDQLKGTPSNVTQDLIDALADDLRKGIQILEMIEERLGNKSLSIYFKEFEHDIDTVNETLQKRLAIISSMLSVDIKKDTVDMKSALVDIKDGVNSSKQEMMDNSKVMFAEMNQKLDLIIARLTTMESSLQEQRRHEPPAARGSDEPSAKRSKTDVQVGDGRSKCLTCGNSIGSTGVWFQADITAGVDKMVWNYKCRACPKDPKVNVVTGDMICGVCGGDFCTDNWVCCDTCLKGFHRSCVEMTAAESLRIKHFKCPACSEGLGPGSRKCGVCKDSYWCVQWVRCGKCDKEFHNECVGIAAAECCFSKVFKCPLCSREQ